ncbi:MAG TPA: hypothetical protein VGV38_01315 [Pyrinomonadaceae bacterium]|nr:hypothetical protein [Pyrinomonadaceae bacterium]
MSVFHTRARIVVLSLTLPAFLSACQSADTRQGASERTVLAAARGPFGLGRKTTNLDAVQIFRLFPAILDAPPAPAEALIRSFYAA